MIFRRTQPASSHDHEFLEVVDIKHFVIVETKGDLTCILLRCKCGEIIDKEFRGKWDIDAIRKSYENAKLEADTEDIEHAVEKARKDVKEWQI